MEEQTRISEQAIKKTVAAITVEVDGVAELKQVTYIEEAEHKIVHVTVNMKIGTIVHRCA